MADFSPGSTDYVYAEIRNNGEPAAAEPDIIEFAFIPDGLKLARDHDDWHTAHPEGDLHAQVRIGAYQDGIELDPGTYDMYIRLTAGDIRPVIPSGPVVIE